MNRALLYGLTVLLLGGCTQVFSVKEKNGTSDKSVKQAGVPFFVKTEKYQKTSVYDVTWLRATLTVQRKWVQTKDAKETLPELAKQTYVKELVKPGLQLNPIRDAILRANGGDITEAMKVIHAFESIPDIAPLAERTAEPVKNSIDSVWVVDGSKTYYLNGPLPWFGTGNLTQELNPDGTLSKVTSNPEQKLAEGLSTLLPIKEFLTGRFVKSAVTAADKTSIMSFDVGGPPPPPAADKYVIDMALLLEELGYEYSLMTVPSTVRPDSSRIPFDKLAAPDVLFTRKELGGAKSSDDKKDDGSKIGLSGTITFPKDWGTAKPSSDKKPGDKPGK